MTRTTVELIDRPVNELETTTTVQSGLTDDTNQSGDPEKDLSDLENQTTINSGEGNSENNTPCPMEGMVREIEGVAIHYQRPDIEAIIRTTVSDTHSDHQVLVLGCGPDRLMKKVRNTTASCIKSEGPSVELHCEQFGW